MRHVRIGHVVALAEPERFELVGCLAVHVATGVIGGTRSGGRRSVSQVALCSCLIGLRPLAEEHWDSYRCQYPDDDHDDQKLDEGEATFVARHLLHLPQPLAKPVQHRMSPLCDACSCCFPTMLLGPLYFVLDSFSKFFRGIA